MLGPEARSSNLSASQKIKIYRDALKSMERFLDVTDRRMFTPIYLSKLTKDLREIIVGLKEIRDLKSIDEVLSSLRRAQIELDIAVDMLEAKSKFTEGNRRSYYKCLNNFQEYLYEALRYF